MTPREILDLPMQENDADAATVRDYLKALLRAVWDEGEGFSGKRPFGNSGWDSELKHALVKAGAVRGTVNDRWLDDCDDAAAETLIRDAIAAMN